MFRRQRSAPEDEVVVHSVTTVPARDDDDSDARVRNYLIMMGIRIVCFVLLLVIQHPIRWVFIVIAVFIPYFAVVVANARSPQRPGTITPVTPAPPEHRQVHAGRITSHHGASHHGSHPAA